MEYWSDASLFHNIAHRGAFAYAAENSLKAFELARKHCATDVEVDLHCTSDGEFVVRHNAMMNGKSLKFISELPYDEYRFICHQQLEPIIRLDQVIEVAKKNNLGIYLDITGESLGFQFKVHHLCFKDLSLAAVDLIKFCRAVLSLHAVWQSYSLRPHQLV